MPPALADRIDGRVDHRDRVVPLLADLRLFAIAWTVGFVFFLVLLG